MPTCTPGPSSNVIPHDVRPKRLVETSSPSTLHAVTHRRLPKLGEDRNELHLAHTERDAHGTILVRAQRDPVIGLADSILNCHRFFVFGGDHPDLDRERLGQLQNDERHFPVAVLTLGIDEHVGRVRRRRDHSVDAEVHACAHIFERKLHHLVEREDEGPRLARCLIVGVHHRLARLTSILGFEPDEILVIARFQVRGGSDDVALRIATDDVRGGDVVEGDWNTPVQVEMGVERPARYLPTSRGVFETRIVAAHEERIPFLRQERGHHAHLVHRGVSHDEVHRVRPQRRGQAIEVALRIVGHVARHHHPTVGVHTRHRTHDRLPGVGDEGRLACAGPQKIRREAHLGREGQDRHHHNHLDHLHLLFSSALSFCIYDSYRLGPITD